MSELSGMSVQAPYKFKQSVPLFTAIMWTIGALAAGCFVVALLNLREPEIGPTVVAGDTASGGSGVASELGGVTTPAVGDPRRNIASMPNAASVPIVVLKYILGSWFLPSSAPMRSEVGCEVLN
jgi:hypothetical protein